MRQSRQFVVIAAVLASIAACTDPAAPIVQLPREGKPLALEFAIGSWGGTTYQLRGDTVVRWYEPYALRPGEVVDTVRVVPSPDEWRDFWASVDRAGISQWRPNYETGDLDGTGWHLRLDTGNGTIESRGNNAFPDRFGEQHDHEIPADFRVLLNAFDVLTAAPLAN